MSTLGHKQTLALQQVMSALPSKADMCLGLALVATLLSIWLRIATALSEIVVGTIAQLVIGAVIGAAMLGTDQTWAKFLSGTGAILLTFLAGAELDPVVFRERWKEAGAIGLISFLVPSWVVRPQLDTCEQT